MARSMQITAKLEGGEELIEQLRQMQTTAGAALRDAARAGAEVLKDAANRRAPGPHIDIQSGGSSREHAEMMIGPDKDHWYYRFFETGTAPHDITSKKLLSFEVDGEPVVAKAVKHPGMAARPFLRPALDEEKDRAIAAAGETLRRRLGL